MAKQQLPVSAKSKNVARHHITHINSMYDTKTAWLVLLLGALYERSRCRRVRCRESPFCFHTFPMFIHLLAELSMVELAASLQHEFSTCRN